MAECAPLDFVCQGKEVAASVLGGALEDFQKAVMEGVGKTIASLGTMWVNVGTPTLTWSRGGDTSKIAAGSAGDNSVGIELVLDYVFWIFLVIAIGSLVVLGGMMAVRHRRGEGALLLGKLGVIIAAVFGVSAASAIVSMLMKNGPQNAGGAVLFLQSGLWWYTGALAIAAVVIGAIKMVWEQRAEPGKQTLQGLLTLIVVAGCGVTVVAFLLLAFDGFSTWFINSSLGCDVEGDTNCFGRNIEKLLPFAGASGLGSIVLIFLGIAAICVSIVQIVLMVARGGMLVLLTGTWPTAAAATSTETGKGWFRKHNGWLLAFMLYKPAAAIIYGTAFYLTGTDVFKDDGTGLFSIITGLLMMMLALFAMPALMRAVTPMVGAMASGAAGGAAAAGVLAALPSGAASLGRLMGGSKGESGQDGAMPPSGSESATGGRAQQQQPTAQPASTNGSAEAGAAASQSGASAGGGATAGAGAGAGAAAGGGAAAGASTGAAAGPWGAAAGAAIGVAKQAGQAASGAAKQLGDDATGNGEGSGS